jgi:hypothetical protein
MIVACSDLEECLFYLTISLLRVSDAGYCCHCTFAIRVRLVIAVGLIPDLSIQECVCGATSIQIDCMKDSFFNQDFCELVEIWALIEGFNPIDHCYEDGSISHDTSSCAGSLEHDEMALWIFAEFL